MPSNAFTFRIVFFIDWAINVFYTATVEAQVLDTVNFPTVYGVPGAIDATSNKFRKIGAGDATANIYGMYVCNVLKRGYMTVLLGGTTPSAKNGVVYVRVANAAAGKPLGGIEAASDTTNTIVMPGNTYFTGPADANGNVEIAFNI